MLPSVSSLSERLRAVAQAGVEQFDHAGQALHVRGTKAAGSNNRKDNGSSNALRLGLVRSQSPSTGDDSLSARQMEKRPASIDGGSGTNDKTADSLQSRLMRIASTKTRGKHNPASSIDRSGPVDPASIPLPPSPELVAEDGVRGDEDDALALIPDASPLLVGDAAAQPRAIQAGSDQQTEVLAANPANDALQVMVDRANAVLREASPLLQEGIANPDALEGWIRMMIGKVDMGAAELKRMSDRLSLQESRMEEIRDTHRLESSSSTKLIQELREQLSQSETTLSSQAAQQLEIAQLKADLKKAQTQAKEEEEKRSKAISLLKTVRQKLVKLEKEKEEGDRLKDDDRQERQRMVENLEKLRGEREKEVSNLRAGFEKEAASLRDKYDRDVAAKKAQWELDMITTKAAHAKEIAQKVARISSLESSVKELQSSRQEQFQALQAKQDDVDRHRTEAEALEARTKELAFQLKEAQDRLSVLEEETSVARGAVPNAASGTSQTEGVASATQPQGISPADLSRLLAEAQAKAELKLSELRSEVARSERDRLESEEESARHLQDRAKELERLRAVIREKDAEYAEAVRGRRDRDEQIAEVERSKETLRVQIVVLQEKVDELEADKGKMVDLEFAISEAKRNHAKELQVQNERLEEAKATVNQLRHANKTLREEMRKLQSSVQLLEKQRNPGVGYWSSGSAGGGPVQPTPNRAATNGGNDDSRTSGTQTPDLTHSPHAEEEEVNLEYLRNVILQFLEKEEMRPNLVRVLSVILRFTPQELRRLQAKIGA